MESGQIKSLQELLEKAKSYFLTNLNNLDEKELAGSLLTGSSLKDKKTLLLNRCYSIINKAESSINKYDSGDESGGLEDFYKIFFPSDKASEVANIKEIHPRNFYRMRHTDKKHTNGYEFYKRKDLFMISKENDRFISRTRFNDEGKPCLYLASSLYLAWEECRRPDFNQVNISLFHNQRTLKVMSINIIRNMKSFGDFIMGYFTLLCCMKNNNDDDRYKFQYTISNLFMKILIMNNLRDKKGGEIDGIEYLSSRRYNCKDFLFDAHYNNTAYVFPPKENGVKDYCSKLARLFKMTDPKTYFFYKAHRFSFDSTIAKVSDYSDSLFAEMEKQLGKEDLFFFDDV